MESKSAVDALSALAHEGRLAIFRALVRAGPAGLAAGKLGEAVGIAGSTLSNNLTVLTRAGLAAFRVPSPADSQFYRSATARPKHPLCQPQNNGPLPVSHEGGPLVDPSCLKVDLSSLSSSFGPLIDFGPSGVAQIS